jgi:hypothetical protein
VIFNHDFFTISLSACFFESSKNYFYPISLCFA